MTGIAESHVEEATLEWFSQLGYATYYGPDICPDGRKPEREAYSDVFLRNRLERAVAALNPHIPVEARQDALRMVAATEFPNLTEENRRLHRLLVEGVDVEFPRDDGSIAGAKVRLIDFETPDNNDWLAVNQFTVIEGKINRRPDVVVFINGLPLGVIELKNPGTEEATLEAAFNQLQTYQKQITSLFRTNGVLPKSGGSGECIMKSNIATSPTHHSGLRFQILEGSKGVVGEILKS